MTRRRAFCFKSATTASLVMRSPPENPRIRAEKKPPPHEMRGEAASCWLGKPDRRTGRGCSLPALGREAIPSPAIFLNAWGDLMAEIRHVRLTMRGGKFPA